MEKEQIKKAIKELNKCLFLGTHEENQEIAQAIRLLEKIKLDYEKN